FDDMPIRCDEPLRTIDDIAPAEARLAIGSIPNAIPRKPAAIHLCPVLREEWRAKVSYGVGPFCQVLVQLAVDDVLQFEFPRRLVLVRRMTEHQADIWHCTRVSNPGRRLDGERA